MKTIAITIDEGTLTQVERIREEGGRRASRSEIVRRALRAYAGQIDRAREEEHEREVFRRHRGLLRRQADALVREQAEP
jgi:Arc/MetJ-type ribon-helix-helix transcriptional regulator